MSDHKTISSHIPKAVSLEQAEQITANIVGPMLALTAVDISICDGDDIRSPREGEVLAAANFEAPIKCLHLWQAAITAIAMKIQSQNVLAYLLSIHSLDFQLRNRLAHDIQVADDNLNFVSEELLKYGITL